MSLSLPSTGPQTPPTTLAEGLGRIGAGWIATILAAAFVFASLYFDRPQSYDPIVIRFLDPDDAMRLAQVRSFLAGGSWFEPMIASIGDGEGLRSHWSRLLDAPIAGLILAARLFVDEARAEQIALLLWPKLVLFGFMALLLRQAIREVSAEAALALGAMLWLSLFSLVQFQLTRIDHHNVQNACAALAILLATSPLATRRSAVAAGLIAGLGLAIGYEALPVIGALAALLAAFSLGGGRARAIAECFAVGLAAALAAAFLATTPPKAWLAVPCDALGLNVVVGASLGAAGLIAAGRIGGSMTLRLAALAAAGLAAAVGFALVEPACLAGPFAKVDPAMGPLWLDHVMEARPLHGLAATKPSLAAALALSMLACLAAQAAAAWASRAREDVMRLVLLALLTAIAFRYLKMIPYAQLVGLFCLVRAAFTLRLPHPQLTPRAAAMLALLFATPLPLLLALSAFLPADAAEQAEAGRGCVAEQDFGALAALPSARILPQPDLGGFLALLGRHHSMIGNYHRLDREIARAAAIFAAPVYEAKVLLDEWRIDIVAHCAGKRIFPQRTGEGSLARAIERGEALPSYLIPIDLGVASGVRAWRVSRP